jgi:hypothetical protein
MNHPEPVRLDRTPSIESDPGGHPLFPRPETETGPDPRKFDIIVIHRWLPDGTREVCPKPWKGSELRSWQQIIDQYGGECTYQLGAQCGKTHRFQAWSEKMFFAGPARKPFVEQPRTPAPAPAAPAPQYIYPPMPPQSGRSDDMVALLRVMMETNATIQTALMKSLLERQPQTDPLMVVREIMPLIKGDNPSKTGSGAVYERGMERGIELAKQIGGAAPSGGGSDDLGDIEKIFRLFSLAKSTTAAAPSAQPQPQPQPVAPPAWPAAPSGYPAPVGSPWEGWECFHTAMGWAMRPATAHQPPFAWPAPPASVPPPPAPVAPPVPAAPPPAPPVAPPVPAAPPPAPVAPPVPAAPPPAPVAPPVPAAPPPALEAPPPEPMAPAPEPVAPPASVPLPAAPVASPVPTAPPTAPVVPPAPVPLAPAAPAPEPVTVPEAVTDARNLAAELLSRPPAIKPGRSEPAEPPAIKPGRREPAELATPLRFPRMATAAPFLTAAGLVTAPDDETLADGEPDDDPLQTALATGVPLLDNAGFAEKAAAVLMNGDMEGIGALIAMATQKRGSP